MNRFSSSRLRSAHVIWSSARDAVGECVWVTHIVNINKKDHKTLNFNFYKSDGEKMFYPLLRWFVRTTPTTKPIKFQHIRSGREWETRRTSDFVVCKQRSSGIQTAEWHASKYFCSSQIITCAFIHFMHISYETNDVQSTMVALHSRAVFIFSLRLVVCAMLCCSLPRPQHTRLCMVMDRTWHGTAPRCTRMWKMRMATLK